MKEEGSGPDRYKFDRSTVKKLLIRVNTYIEVIAKEEADIDGPHIESMLVFQLLSDMFSRNIEFNFKQGGLTAEQALENINGLKKLAENIFSDGEFEEGQF